MQLECILFWALSPWMRDGCCMFPRCYVHWPHKMISQDKEPISRVKWAKELVVLVHSQCLRTFMNEQANKMMTSKVATVAFKILDHNVVVLESLI